MRQGGLLLAVAAVALLAVPAVGQTGLEEGEPPTPRAGDMGLYLGANLSVEGVPADDEPHGWGFRVGEPAQIPETREVHREAWPVQAATLASESTIGMGTTAWVTNVGAGPIVVDRPAGTQAWHYHDLLSETLRETETYQAPVHARLLATSQGTPIGPACGLWETGGAAGEAIPVRQRFPCLAGTEEGLGPWSLELSVRHEAGDPGEEGWVERIRAEGEAVEIRASIAWEEDSPYPVSVEFSLARRAPIPASTTPLFPVAEALMPWVPRAAPGSGAIPSDTDGDGWVRASGQLHLERLDHGRGESIPLGPDGRQPLAETPPGSGELTRWGPRSGSSPFDLTLEEAVEAIETHPALAGYRQWADQHPDHRVQMAGHREYSRSGAVYEAWGFLQVAPDGTGRWLAVREWTGAASGGDRIDPSRVDTRPLEVYSEEMDSKGGYPEALSEPVPTVAAVLDGWQSRAKTLGSADEPNYFVWTHQGTDAEALGGRTSPDQTRFEPGDPTRYRYSLNASWVSYQGPDWEPVGWFEVQTNGSASSLEELTGSPSTGTTAGDRTTEGAHGFLDLPLRPAAGLGLLTLLGIALRYALARLYSRINREELLEHPTRRRIYELLEEGDPPTTMDLVSEVDACRSTVRHHLSKLEDGDLVEAVKVCGEKRWFRRTEASLQEMRVRALLDVGETRRVYKVLCSHPGSTLTQVAARVGMDPAATHRVIDRLVEAGLVERDRNGHGTEHRPVDP